MRRVGAIFVAAMVGVAPSAHAQTKGGSASLSPQDEANARFQTGLKFYDARDFESARLAFAQAYAVLKKPAILLNLALSELYADRPLDALGHLDTFLSDPQVTPEKKERATKARAEAYAKTGHLRIKAAKGAEVKVDGDMLAQLPDVVNVAAGEHAVTASAGEVAQTRTVMAVAGNVTEVDVMPPPLPPQAPMPPERVSWVTARNVTGLAFVALGLGAFAYGFVETAQKSDDEDRADGLRARLAPGACRGVSGGDCGALAGAVDDARAHHVQSLVGFGAGAVLAGTGIVLLATSPVVVFSGRRAAVGPGPGQAGVTLRLTF